MLDTALGYMNNEHIRINKGLLQSKMNIIANRSSIHAYMDSDPIRISNFFICNDKTSISSFYLCDGSMDCSDKEDELFCHLFNNLLTPSQTCEMLVDANVKNYSWICPQLKMNIMKTGAVLWTCDISYVTKDLII